MTRSCIPVLITIVLSGCSNITGSSSGSPSGAVGADATANGKVTWKDKPVQHGMVIFEDADGKTASLPIRDGQYGRIGAAERLTSGSKTVRIYGGNEIKTGKKKTVSHSGGVVLDTIEHIIPDEYNKNSSLKVDIKAGENALDFILPKS